MSDEPPNGALSVGLKIGALVVCEGEIYKLIGIDPAGVRRPSAYLKNPATAETSRVPGSRGMMARFPAGAIRPRVAATRPIR